jgi:hypothetical protein
MQLGIMLRDTRTILGIQMFFGLKFDVTPVYAVYRLYLLYVFSTHAAANDDDALYRWRYYTIANLITAK